jgi:hypothetical protein
MILRCLLLFARGGFGASGRAACLRSNTLRISIKRLVSRHYILTHLGALKRWYNQSIKGVHLMPVTLEFVLQFAHKYGCATSTALFAKWDEVYDSVGSPPSGYENWPLLQMAQWIADHYTGPTPNP